jgi:SAM-dependent methyltransferase
MTERFRTGGGIEWGHQHPCLFQGTERFFRSSYIGNLVQSWLPALDGVVAKLERGAKVADIGCGVGASTILMAKAFPKSKFFGFDYHQGSLDAAMDRAKKAGVTDRVKFTQAKAKDYPGTDYDFVTFFDCLHDMGDPAGAAKHVKQSLRKDGTWMWNRSRATTGREPQRRRTRLLLGEHDALRAAPLAFGGPGLGAQVGETRLRGSSRPAFHALSPRDGPFNFVSKRPSHSASDPRCARPPSTHEKRRAADRLHDVGRGHAFAGDRVTVREEVRRRGDFVRAPSSRRMLVPNDHLARRRPFDREQITCDRARVGRDTTAMVCV